MSTETSAVSPKNLANAGTQQDPSPTAAQSELTGPQDANSSSPSQANRERLNELLRHAFGTCGPGASKHDLAIVGITICLDQGVVTLPHLISILRPWGFHRGHIARLLKEGTGNDPSRNRWHRSEAGNHTLHVNALGFRPRTSASRLTRAHRKGE